MAATWYPSDSFKPLAMRLFIIASYASTACYPMDDCDVINISLCVIKRCEMYAEKYKNRILHENAVPPIVKTIKSFKGYWADTMHLSIRLQSWPHNMGTE